MDIGFAAVLDPPTLPKKGHYFSYFLNCGRNCPDQETFIRSYCEKRDSEDEDHLYGV